MSPRLPTVTLPSGRRRVPAAALDALLATELPAGAPS